MTEAQKLRVACARARNTQLSSIGTQQAMQPDTQQKAQSPLKQAALRVLARNSARNSRATGLIEARNSDPSLELHELHADGLREAFEERAAILEHDAGLSRTQAELEAARMTATKARNRGYTWTALRQALSSCPELLAEIPDRPGLVDALPLGVSRFAVLPGRVVVKQGRSHGN